MKILALNGSYRGKAGYTQWLLEKIAEGATAAGAEFETIVLAEKKIIHCAGCERCHTAEHYLHCVYETEDDVKAIFDRMKTADIIVYATPVYVFNLSGLMKTFFERLNSTIGTDSLCVTESGLLFGRVDKAFHSKPFVVLTCCGNVEAETTKNVVSYFKTIAKFLDAPIVGVLERKSIGEMEPAKTIGAQSPKPVVTEVANAFIQAGRELATAGKIAAGTERRANQHILGIPFFDFLMNFRLFKKMAVKNKR